MQIGRERVTLKRWLAIAAGLALAVSVSWAWWPTAADCRRGNVEACQLRALAALTPASLPPFIFFSEYATVEWPDSSGRVGPQVVKVLPANDLLWRTADKLILTRFAVFVALFLGGIIATYLLWSRAIKPPADQSQRVVRGTRIAVSKKQSKENPDRLYVGDVEIPPEAEAKSFLAVSSPGGGKSQALVRMLRTMLRRGDLVVCVDPGGEAMRGFFKKGHTLFNPLDARSVSWSPFAEMSQPWDAMTIAASIIGGIAGNDEKAGWNQKAMQLVAAVLQRLWETGRATNKDLLYFLTIAGPDELEALVAGLPAQGLFARGADRALGSVKFITSARLAGYVYLDPAAGRDAFSFKEWFDRSRKGGGTLWMPWRADQRLMLGPLYGTVVDMLAAHVMSKDPDRSARMAWLIADELPTLGRVDSLLNILGEGRKFRFAACAAIQSPSQVEAEYGKAGLKTMMTCFQSLLILRAKEADAQEYLSKVIGDREIETAQISVSKSTGGEGNTTTSMRTERKQERAVLPSQLRELPDRTGYLLVAGAEAVEKVRIPIVELEPHEPAFIPRNNNATPAVRTAAIMADAPERRKRSAAPGNLQLRELE